MWVTCSYVSEERYRKRSEAKRSLLFFYVVITQQFVALVHLIEDCFLV